MSKKTRFKVVPAVYLILRRGNKVLLSKRCNTGYQDGMYSLVAGHVDGGERAEDAMVREAYEEVGIKIQPTDLQFAHLWHRLNEDLDDERIDIGFECHQWDGEIKNNEPEKCAELIWSSIDNLPANTIPHVKNVLELVGSGVAYSSYGKGEKS